MIPRWLPSSIRFQKCIILWADVKITNPGNLCPWGHTTSKLTHTTSVYVRYWFKWRDASASTIFFPVLDFSCMFFVSALCITRKYADTRDVTSTATCVTGQHVLRWGRDMSRFWCVYYDGVLAMVPSVMLVTPWPLASLAC